MGKPMRQVLDDISRTYNSVLECMEDSREKVHCFNKAR